MSGEYDRAALERIHNRYMNQPKQIDNGSLHAGSPMYFYCEICGHESDRLPETYVSPPKKLCKDCKDFKDTFKLTNQTIIQLVKELK